jgi:hypothetical protein
MRPNDRKITVGKGPLAPVGMNSAMSNPSFFSGPKERRTSWYDTVRFASDSVFRMVPVLAALIPRQDARWSL